MISREAAEDALRHCDWVTAEEHLLNLLEMDGQDPAALTAWADAIEASALPLAEAGDLHAQQALGSLGVTRFLSLQPPDPEGLRRGLRWIVAALRQSPSSAGLQMLVWYNRSLHRLGVHDAEVDAYLQLPEVVEQCRGMPLGDGTPT